LLIIVVFWYLGDILSFFLFVVVFFIALSNVVCVSRLSFRGFPFGFS